jgi:hypothetical protein
MHYSTTEPKTPECNILLIAFDALNALNHKWPEKATEDVINVYPL